MDRNVFLKTYGCQMNERDSETIRSLLLHDGFSLTQDENNANVVILNCCSVRDQAELKAIGKMQYLAQLKKTKKDLFLGICGCMAKNLGEELFKRVPQLNFAIGPEAICHITSVIRRLYEGETKIILLEKNDHELLQNPCNFHRDLSNRKISAFVNISNGCNMNCSYCIVPKTRGKERHRPMESIIKEIQFLVEQGIKEVTLLGQIVNFYGIRQIPFHNGKSPFVQLLEKIHEIKGLERIRFLSPHPCGFHDDLIACYENLHKLCPHVHLPIQSGSDRILRLMRRPYGRAKIIQIVRKLRQRVSLMAISTDIIVGFPGETEKDFHETEQLFDEISPDMAFIFRYSRRTGTEAASMPEQVHPSIALKRNHALLKKVAHHSLQKNLLFLNSIQPVLVEQSSQRDKDIYVGYTPHHRKVFFPASDEVIGEIIPVRITHATTSCLHGICIQNS